MKKHIGLIALVVLTAFTIGWHPVPIQLNIVKIPGTVEKAYPGYVLKSSMGTFRLTGADASKWVGQKVNAFGELGKDPFTDRETITVDRFSPWHE
jgi:hypothetical protein